MMKTMSVSKTRIRTFIILGVVVLICAAIITAFVLPFRVNTLLFGLDSTPAITAIWIDEDSVAENPYREYYTDDPDEISAFLDMLSDYNISLYPFKHGQAQYKENFYQIRFICENKVVRLSVADMGEMILPSGTVVRMSRKQSVEPLASLIANWEEPHF